MFFLLFPNQLFEKKYIPKKYIKNKFYLIEHEKFYGLTDNMIFNKKKIILHKASCLSYIDNMVENNFDIKYVNEYPIIKNSKIVIFDIVDKFITNELLKFYEKLDTEIEILNTPNFMTNTDNLEIFYNKYKKNKKFMHNIFYSFQLKLHNIPYIQKSYDTENRNAIPQNLENKLPNNPPEIINKYIKKAIKFVQKNFPNNYGNTDNFYLPIDHDSAKIWFQKFLKIKMNNFAQYQDAIVPNEPFLYHSVISSILNIGLLNPDYIIQNVVNIYEKKKISIQDYEAFIRQVIGWREYQRFIYIYLQDTIIKKNYFKNNNHLTKHWYNGTLGIQPVDDAIKIAFDYGYLHHIIRLMVICNFMNLCGIHPDDAYKWFMEFSTDSYEWVMIGNVYSMGMWSDGGITMRKPYFSSYNYIDKMSGDRYDTEWKNIWYSLYYAFLIKNYTQLKKTIYARNLGVIDKFDKDKLNIINKTSKKFIDKYTK